jgi:methylenetetrahydrofolate dehydrogenase (NADP+)/methenyltetrahydrofolate cyclohydrolase
LRIKERYAKRAGIAMEVIRTAPTVTTDELVALIASDRHDAIIVQLPLPESIDLQRVLAALPPAKDADALSSATRDRNVIMHPIVAAVESILAAGSIPVEGARAVVIGKGWLVGEPVAAWLARAGAHVTVLTRESSDLSPCQGADIIVSGAGVPGLLTADLVRPGATVIDVGTSELGGSLAGDAAPEVAQVAGVFTPVPGGVGPIAVSYLMRNVAELAEQGRLQAI